MKEIIIQLELPRVEQLLAPYRESIGKDYDGYRNHVYRTITYALHFLNGQHQQLVETALVYHDLGLWTDRDLAYLEPSEAIAIRDNEQHGWG
ncbi:MAG: phosphohydrolase, partial [Planctomycetota bacterium]